MISNLVMKHLNFDRDLILINKVLVFLLPFTNLTPLTVIGIFLNVASLFLLIMPVSIGLSVGYYKN